ncbi:nuclear pore complex protein Nup214 isoform X2 [Osmerus eperlanus]|uniref:nuclear pore complex protein Nup214 isoform X2 n=1 Tax=Osmerus eperlanus TaxID=29151 RepID=UPI002E158474
MSDDPDSPSEREMKDFQFRQMKKTRVFDSPEDLPKERSNLLCLSNKFGLTFVGHERELKVYFTRDIIAADKVEGNSNEIVEGIAALVEVPVELPLHHLALSSDELTLSVCGMSEESGLLLAFYDVRIFINKARPQKLPFASLRPAACLGTCVQDLKWNPVQASILASCLSDGSMMVVEVTGSATIQAQLPSVVGITCLCWSPKGKQVAVGKMNATVSQYTPTLQEKKVIPCPSFYSSDNPVKVLDVLWLSTYMFAVAYAAADGSPETPPELVVVSLPKKEDKREERYLNFNDLVYGTCTERQHHYFLSYIEDWGIVLAASAASIEVSIIAKQEDTTNWELWLLEDASRGELPVTQTNDDTLPLGLAIDYTSQQQIHITDEKTLPPVPTLLILSTDGVLCPFALLNLNPGAKQLVTAPVSLVLEGERDLPAVSVAALPTIKPSPGLPPATIKPSPGLPPATIASRPSSAAMAPSTISSPAPFAAPTSSSFSLPFSSSSSVATSSSAFSFGGSVPAFGLATGSTVPSGFSFATKLPSDISSASAFSFSAPLVKPQMEAAPPPASVAPTPQCYATASPMIVQRGTSEPATPVVKLNLNDRFLAVETPVAAPASQTFSFAPTHKTVFTEPVSETIAVTKTPIIPAPVRPVQISSTSSVGQRPAPSQTSNPTSQTAAQAVKTLEKELKQRKDSDPVMAGILEEIGHFQKELDELKARSNKADFRVGTGEEMRELRKESEDLHVFTLEIKETTESLHCDISTLKTTMLEGFAGAEDARAQGELSRDRGYLQLLYKKPLDPRSEDQLKEIRRLYQYVKFAVEDVNDVLDVEWEKHLEKKKKQKHMIVPEREALFTALANNLDIINQQKQRLEQLVKELHILRLYRETATWSAPPLLPSQPKLAPAVQTTAVTPTNTQQGQDNELESLRNAFLKASLEATPKGTSKSPAKMSPVKQSQLRNFLSKRQTPPVRSTAPAYLSRSAFLSPTYYEDLDEVSTTSSFSQALDPNHTHPELEEEEDLEPEPAPLPVLSPVSVPRHPTVVRTPSIQPGFGAIQSTPFSKVHHPGLGLGLSPIISPVTTNKIHMGGADSTALATKTVKHGAPPTEKATPVTIPAQQAAATAALRRQMANQKPVSASPTESTLKNIPQVVNVQDFKDKGPPMPVSTVISSSVPAPAAQVVQQVLATVATTNQAKRNSTQGILKVSTEGTAAPLSGLVLGEAPKPDGLVPSTVAQSQGMQSSKAFSFTTTSISGFSFSSVTQEAANSQVKDVAKFSFSGSSNAGKMFCKVEEGPFSFTPKSTSPALGGDSFPTPPPSMSGEAGQPSSISPALPVEPQGPKVGGETLGIFSGLRVGQGDEEVKDVTKPSAFSFGQPNNEGGLDVSAAHFHFGAALQQGKPAEVESEAKDLSKTTKPPEPSFCSLLAAPVPCSSPNPEEKPKAPTPLLDPTPSPERKPSLEPQREDTPPLSAGSVPAGDVPPPSNPSLTALICEKTSTPHVATPSVAPFLPVSVTPPTEGGITSLPLPPSVNPESTQETAPNPISSLPLTLESAPPPPPYHPLATSDKPGSICSQPTPPDDTSMAVPNLTLVINTAAPTATTLTPTVANIAPISSASVFEQPVLIPSSSASAPALASAATSFCTPSFGANTGGGAFGTQTVFGQGGGFGQPAPNTTGSAASFGFGQSAFGTSPGFSQHVATATPVAASSSATTTAGGSLFGGPISSNASSFSFGTSNNASAASSTGIFGQSATPGFGQQSSGFGQGSVFGGNTTTTSSTGFSFGQPSAFGSSATSSVFGQQPSGGSVFGQQQPSGGGLFGSGSTAPAAPGCGVFFSGLGGKPSDDAASKNPFGATPSTGGFGQPSQPGSSSLFGSSGAKTFGFGQTSSFGEQKPSGTFSTAGGSVAAQGFGSFSTPAKPGGFGSAPVFGSPPAFGGSPAFGGAAAFSSAPSFSSPMGSTAGKVFGEGTAAANMGGFGFASPQSGPTFGSLASQSAAPSFSSLAQQQPASGFGAPQPGGFSGFGQSGAGAFSGGFGSTNPLTPRWPGLQ